MAPHEVTSAQAAFRHAWDDPTNTAVSMPPLDVNAVLEERYRTARPLALTRSMLWENEVRKAWRPGRYLPYRLRSGTAATWAPDPAAPDAFLRRSQQRLWSAPETYGLVLEQAHLDHDTQSVTFLGVAELTGPDGEELVATDRQPLFHVEHSVDGEEDRPTNGWRIVFLTDRPDPHLAAVMRDLAPAPYLPDYVEIYIEGDLEVPLTRRVAASPQPSA